MDDFLEVSWACLAGSGALGRAPVALGGWSVFFTSLSEVKFFDFGAILGGFGKPNRRPKSIFGMFFFDVFFECVSASILGGFFWRLGT